MTKTRKNESRARVERVAWETDALSDYYLQGGDNIANISNYRRPEVSFIDNLTLKDVQNKLLADYAAKHKELTGKTVDVPLADPVRLILYATALLGYQCLQYIDRAGKMDLLKYSVGNYLDNIATLKGILRKPAISATTAIRFTLSSIRTSATGIPGGTRVRDDNGKYFMTSEYAEIPAGRSYVDVEAAALEAGVRRTAAQPYTRQRLLTLSPYIAGRYENQLNRAAATR